MSAIPLSLGFAGLISVPVVRGQQVVLRLAKRVHRFCSCFMFLFDRVFAFHVPFFVAGRLVLLLGRRPPFLLFWSIGTQRCSMRLRQRMGQRRGK